MISVNAYLLIAKNGTVVNLKTRKKIEPNKKGDVKLRLPNKTTLTISAKDIKFIKASKVSFVNKVASLADYTSLLQVYTKAISAKKEGKCDLSVFGNIANMIGHLTCITTKAKVNGLVVPADFLGQKEAKVIYNDGVSIKLNTGLISKATAVEKGRLDSIKDIMSKNAILLSSHDVWSKIGVINKGKITYPAIKIKCGRKVFRVVPNTETLVDTKGKVVGRLEFTYGVISSGIWINVTKNRMPADLTKEQKADLVVFKGNDNVVTLNAADFIYV